MSMKFTKRTLFSGIIAASSISTLAFAQPEEGFTVTPSIGYYNMDNERGIDNDTAYSLGLGYQFNNPWAVEFTYLNADTNQTHAGGKVGVDQYKIDALYSLPEFETTKLTPYLAAGVGTTDLSQSTHSNNALFNAGGGVKYALKDNVALRADYRLINDVEDHHLDNLASIGIQMTFGHQTAPQEAYVEPKENTETEPDLVNPATTSSS